MRRLDRNPEPLARNLTAVPFARRWILTRGNDVVQVRTGDDLNTIG